MVKMREIAALCITLMGVLTLSAQPYRTTPLSPEVKSLQVEVVDRWLSPPIISLGSNEEIEIRFDRMEQDDTYYRYSLIHCNADWTPSSLSSMEYMVGFTSNDIDYWDYSFNTYAHYTHYSLRIPNEDVQLRVSGNYVVKVFPDTDPNAPILYACFSVYESGVQINAIATSITDIGHNTEYQQVEAQVNFAHFPIQNPHTDLRLYITQNGQPESEVVVSNPLYVRGNVIGYEHNRNMIFEAGNEYRRFEMASIRYAGVGIAAIRLIAPLYHATINTDYPRVNTSYRYDETQHGRYLVRESNATDSNLEADYFVVHFTLAMDTPLLDGAIYLDGDFTYNKREDAYKMEYNYTTRQYEKELLLKQGAYNYQYLFVPHNRGKASLRRIEGNYYETSNDYLVKVFYRPFGERYDRLVGITLAEQQR